MATLRSYVERVPQIYWHRYNSRYWVDWANALLERLSGAGFLPPQLLTRGVVVHDKVWIDRPPMSRDVKELRSAANQEFTYRFAEENNRLRLIDAAFNEPETFNVDEIIESGAGFVRVRKGGLAENFLRDWLFVVPSGAAAGHTFIVSRNETADAEGEANVYFLNPPSAAVTFDINASIPAQVQASFFSEDEIPFASAGYFVPPRDYLIVSYVGKYMPVISLSDELGVEGYENLVDAWFRWKVEEQVSSISQECAYWGGRVEVELANLRAEMYNRINKPKGRTLAGFMGNRRYA
jgi:hypothetical protein